MSRVFLFVNGILNRPGCHDEWTDRAATWVNTRTQDRAEKFEYFCGALTRRLFINRHAADLAHLISQYAGKRVVLVGHSNGCELICRALRMTGVAIDQVHLISGACSADFNRNGLNDLIETQMVKRVVVYVAGADLPMRLAIWSQKLLGWIGLGYGSLGYKGPVKLTPGAAMRVKQVAQPTFGHSTWFEPEHFHQTMLEVATR